MRPRTPPIREVEPLMLLHPHPPTPPLPGHRLTPVARGRALILLAFAVSALGSVLAKASLGMGTTPVSFLVLRLVAAVVVLAVLSGRGLWAPGRRQVVRMVVLGAFFGLQSIAFFSALDRAPVALVVVVVAAYPVVVLLLDSAASRTAPAARSLLAMGASVVGLWLAAGSPSGSPDLGVLLALTSAMSYAVYLRLSAGVTAGVAPTVATAWVLGGALLTAGTAAALTGPAVPPAGAAGLAVVHGILATALPIVAIYAALRLVRVADVATLGPLEPVMATALAVGLLGETLGAVEAVGVAVVLVSVGALAGVRPRVGLPRLPLAALPRRPAHRRAPERPAGEPAGPRLSGRAGR